MGVKRSAGPGFLAVAFCGLLASLWPEVAHALRPFQRGKVLGHDGLNIADAVATLNHLFAGGSSILCDDAADANDDGAVNLADAVYTLSYLFLASPPPPPPHPQCGTDPTPDSLGCDFSPHCEEACGSACPEGDVCIQIGPEEFACASALATCEEVTQAYDFLTVGSGPTCGAGCHLLFGHCWMGLGGCYYAAASSVEQRHLDALAARFTALGCSGPVCSCGPRPDVECLAGDCELIEARG